jgi:hypothetical protein
MPRTDLNDILRGHAAGDVAGHGDRVCTPDFEVDGDETVPKVA